MGEGMYSLPLVSQTITVVLTSLNYHLLFGFFLVIGLKVSNFAFLWAANPFNDISEKRRYISSVTYVHFYRTLRCHVYLHRERRECLK
jgi:hypothetical protein